MGGAAGAGEGAGGRRSALRYRGCAGLCPPAAPVGARSGAAEENGVSAVWARPGALPRPGRARAACGGSLSGRGGAVDLDLCPFLSGSG